MKIRTLLFFMTVVAISWLYACGGGSGSSGVDSSGNSNYSGSGFEGIAAPDTGINYLDTAEPINNAGPATVRFLITDAPSPKIDSAIVTISNMTVHKTGGAFFSVREREMTLDLLDLQNGVTALIEEVELEPGKYTQIRFLVVNGTVESGGDTYDVVVPSNVIKLNRNIDVCGDGDLDIVIDFDVEKSLKYNKGQDLFKMKPVVKIVSVTSDCPEDYTEDEEYDGPTGWLSVVLPPLPIDAINAINYTLTTIIEDIRVHDQGIGQVSIFEGPYEVDLLEGERQIIDEETGKPLYTVLVPPVRIPAGDLDQLRLLFQPIIATEIGEEGRTISIELPFDEDADGDGLKFFGSIKVCKDALTILQWDLDLSPANLDFENDEVITIHPEIRDINLRAICE